MQRFGKMHHAPAGCVRNLFTATETVGDDEGIWRGGADRGQEHQLSNLHRHVVVIRFEAEASGHPATAGIERLEVGSGRTQHGLLVIQLRDRLVMTRITYNAEPAELAKNASDSQRALRALAFNVVLLTRRASSACSSRTGENTDTIALLI